MLKDANCTEDIPIMLIDAIRGCLFATSMSRKEDGISQSVKLLKLLRGSVMLRAHINGLYSCGNFYEWVKCGSIPEDALEHAKDVLKAAASW